MAQTSSLEAIHRERERLQKLKAELSAAAAHARAAAWRVEMFHPDRPAVVDQEALDDLQALANVIGLHWVFLLKGHTMPGSRPDWSCTVLPPDWGLEHIAVMVGVFPSLSQARKNGWSGAPVAGFYKENIGPHRIHRVRIV
jgi:hypothetical protein